MPRKQKLDALEREKLLAALSVAYAACLDVQNKIAVYSDVYDAAQWAMFNIDELSEAVTGDRRFVAKMPWR
jgi:hypothetical protein